ARSARGADVRDGQQQVGSHAEWPPKRATTERKLYFQAEGKLSFDAPPKDTEDDHDSYISDPARPAPYRHRPVQATYSQNSGWSTWQTEDQRFVHLRPDVLSYE